MRAPDFWYTAPARPGWQARLLAPIAALYAARTARRIARGTPETVGAPVICVGNIDAGGTGTTPTVIWVMQRVLEAGYRPQAISRAQGGRAQAPVAVDPLRHRAAQVGDAPLLIAAFAPVWVGRDRGATARAAISAGAEVLVLHGGFQDPALKKDVSVVVADAWRGFGNGRCIPAGPLREPVKAALARADVLLTLGDDAAQAAFDPQPADVARATGRLVPLKTGMDWAGARVVAFAGIGDRGKLFATLRDLGATVLHAEVLDDRAAPHPGLLNRLQAQARALDAQLVTTETDAVRLPVAFRSTILTLPMRLEVDREDGLLGPIWAALGRS